MDWGHFREIFYVLFLMQGIFTNHFHGGKGWFAKKNSQKYPK